MFIKIQQYYKLNTKNNTIYIYIIRNILLYFEFIRTMHRNHTL